MDLKNKVKEQANYSLEAVGNAIEKSTKQVNKNFLPRIKEIIMEIANGNYSNLHEFKGIVVNNTPEGSGPDNDIFSMDVRGGGVSLPLGQFLSELISLVEKLLEENSQS